MKITLAAIVGNEEAIIERFIRSFAPAVDSIVLVRATGTQFQDWTIRKAQELCAELGKPIHVDTYINATDFPHVDNFGAARQTAWEIAIRTEPDWLLWADADDILAEGAAETLRDAAESGEHDVYIAPYHVRGDKQVVMRERLIKASVGSRWRYPVHEQLAFPRNVTYRILANAVFIHSPLETKSGSHERNLGILESQVEESSRNFFYLAQEFFQTNQVGKFKRAAKASLACGNLDKVEQYELLLQISQVGDESKRNAAEAFALMPDRREALALLANYAILDGDYKKSLTLAERIMDTPRPSMTYWNQNNEWYGWKGEELYRQCLRLNGRADEAQDHFADGQDQERVTFSIIHATLGRPEKALAIREMWLSRARFPQNVQYVFGLHDFDPKSISFLKGFEHTITESKGAAINYDTASGIARGEIIIQAQDDCYPPEGWDVALLEIVETPNDPVFVACADGTRTDDLTVCSIMTRAYMDIKANRDPGENGFMHRGYTTVFPDTENSFRAIQDGKAGVCHYVKAPQFVIYHDHPLYNPLVPWDATYEWENCDENYRTGSKLFAQRNPAANSDTFKA
jgi:hypothetical protein